MMGLIDSVVDSPIGVSGLPVKAPGPATRPFCLLHTSADAI